MTGRSSKQKGASFERLVARQILEAAGHGFSKEDCFRTPLSGGHPYAGASDLVISPKLLRIFPFCVECKHRASFRLEHFFHPTKELISYHDQVLQAVKKDRIRIDFDPDKPPAKRAPLLVIKGGHGCDAVVAMPEHISALYLKNQNCLFDPSLNYCYGGQTWTACKFPTLLKAVSYWSRNSRCDSTPTNKPEEASFEAA